MRDGEYILGTTVTIGPAQVPARDKEDYIQTRPEDDYYNRVKRFFPNLKREDIELNTAGIQARLKGETDFVMRSPDNEFPYCINLLGIDSPGLTSALSIAEEVCERVQQE